jgi:hypothetical protein
VGVETGTEVDRARQDPHGWAISFCGTGTAGRRVPMS